MATDIGEIARALQSQFIFLLRYFLDEHHQAQKHGGGEKVTAAKHNRRKRHIYSLREYVTFGGNEFSTAACCKLTYLWYSIIVFR
jgi:hypothetical protein